LTNTNGPPPPPTTVHTARMVCAEADAEISEKSLHHGSQAHASTLLNEN
jgi:hypothetical protein